MFELYSATNVRQPLPYESLVHKNNQNTTLQATKLCRFLSLSLLLTYQQMFILPKGSPITPPLWLSLQNLQTNLGEEKNTTDPARRDV
jgi:hypothetical protein